MCSWRDRSGRATFREWFRQSVRRASPSSVRALGGLATAIGLRLRGFDVDVYEAAETLRPVGAGILMQPNAMKVLARLGLATHPRSTSSGESP